MDNNETGKKKPALRGWRLVGVIVCAVLLVAAAAVLVIRSLPEKDDASVPPVTDPELSAFVTRAAQFKTALLGREGEKAPNVSAVPNVGYVLFLSVGDDTGRAMVFSAVGATIAEAWDTAVVDAGAYVVMHDLGSSMLKVDIIDETKYVTSAQLAALLAASEPQHFRYGVAFDSAYSVALLEQEINSNRILDNDLHAVSLLYLNEYLALSERDTLAELPDELRLFSCRSWYMDESGAVLELESSGPAYGHRAVGLLKAEDASAYAEDGAQWLLNNRSDDGSFLYGLYARYSTTLTGYSVIRHASTVWALVKQYETAPGEELLAAVDSSIDWLLGNVVYSDENTAFIYEPNDDVYKSGAAGITVAVLTEYMDVFGTDKYTEVCQALGRGLLAMQDSATGAFVQVFNSAFEPSVSFAAAYYDGAAIFALCRLYELDRAPQWLSAARSAADYIINADYTVYADCWVALAMDELTLYLTDERFYTFALRNAQENLEKFHDDQTASPDELRLLVSVLRLIDRIRESGVTVSYLDYTFDIDAFREMVYLRAERVLDAYIWPETAMYLAEPYEVEGTFMIREEGFVIRMDGVADCVLALREYADSCALLADLT